MLNNHQYKEHKLSEGIGPTMYLSSIQANTSKHLTYIIEASYWTHG